MWFLVFVTMITGQDPVVLGGPYSQEGCERLARDLLVFAESQERRFGGEVICYDKVSGRLLEMGKIIDNSGELEEDGEEPIEQ